MHAVIGRDRELAAIAAFLGSAGPRALVLAGRPGIGKTTLWSAAIAAAGEQGMRVLSARPSGAEAELSFTALIDLCDGIDLAGLDGVPAPRRTALEVALLRAGPTGPPPEPHAIALGLANKQIAQTLFVTVHTVEVHLSRAYQKLGVRSRSQLAARLQS